MLDPAVVQVGIVDVNAQRSNGCSAMSAAVLIDSPHVMRMLVDAGAEVTPRSDEYLATRAGLCGERPYESAKLLIRTGALPPNERSFRILQIAAVSAHCEKRGSGCC